MRVHVCGVRGSTPIFGSEFLRHGGQTSCVALAHDGQQPSMVIDGGTGLSVLARELGDRPFRGTILLSHVHWDHVMGLPFFTSGDRDDARVSVRLPAQRDDDLLLPRLIGPPFFPITPSQLKGDWSVVPLQAGTVELEGFAVLALDIPHRGGRTFGFRVTAGGRTLAYLSDHSPTDLGTGPDGHGARHPAALALCEGADLVLHDAQYTAAEFEQYRDFGHSTVEYAVALARLCSVKRLMLYHHAPGRTDDELDALVARHAGDLQDGDLRVSASAAGDVVDLPCLLPQG
jgi:phosphoribosyl 1,2-cyclic phosphodiesterase